MKIAIVGGGLSGSLIAMQLLKRARPGLQLYLFEKSRGQLNKGIAYSSQLPHQLLNVPVKDMSLFTDKPGHFYEWLAATKNNFGPDDFAPRDIYGQYIADTFKHISAGVKDDVLTTLCEEVTQIDRVGEEYMLAYGNGQQVKVNKVVLCTGNFPPGDVQGLSAEVKNSGHYISHPWGGFNINTVKSTDDVLMLGSGLTMVDLVLSLAKSGHKGNITVISRRGLLPLPHGETRPFALSLPNMEHTSAVALLQWVRANVKEAESQGMDWRSVINAIRPHIPALWAAMPTEEKQRFMRHLRPFWEIHRHRMPKNSIAVLQQMQQQHKLSLVAGKIQNAVLFAGRVKVSYRKRNSNEIKNIIADTVINCTGPETEYRKLRSLLYQSLIENKLAHPDMLSLGIDVTPDGFIIEPNGKINYNMAVVGPPAKGILWECTALREIRIQAEGVAKKML